MIAQYTRVPQGAADGGWAFGADAKYLIRRFWAAGHEVPAALELARKWFRKNCRNYRLALQEIPKIGDLIAAGAVILPPREAALRSPFAPLRN